MRSRLKVLERIVLPGIALSGILAMLFSSWSCEEADPGKIAPVSIGTTTSEVNSLILVAQGRGYFSRNGLDVTHKIYPSGVAALDGVSNHEVDMATGSEFALAGQVLEGKDILTIGAISRASVEFLVGRVDRKIGTVADLKGKTIGVPLGSRPEFALNRFLSFRSIKSAEVTLVNVPVNQPVDALVSGRVDAVATWQPYIDHIQDRMGSGVVIWDVQEDQPSYTLVMCSGQWTTSNPGLVVRFLKSLVQAEGYITSNPEQAKVLVQQRLNYDDAYMASVWPDYRFSVVLEQSLITAMEDQARWIISKNVTTGKQTPNFLKHIYLDGLKAVRPEAVDIIH